MTAQGGWNIDDALLLLRGKMDPYIWEQGEELYRRGAVEDFAIQADGTVQVRVIDPRDSRTFFVRVVRRQSGEVVPVCRCPYQLRGYCRHQVVALEYLRAVSEGEVEPEGEAEESAPRRRREPAAAAADPFADVDGPVLYHLFDRGIEVATRPDGSLLRVVLHELGSSRTPHRVSLKLFTGTGWTDLRTGDPTRWIRRGERAPHPRDALLVSCLEDEDEDGPKSEIDSETFAHLLHAMAGSDALVDRMDRPVPVSPWPLRLEGRLVRGEKGGVGVELACVAANGSRVPLDEVSVVPSVAAWVQLASGVFHPLVAGASGAAIEKLQEEDLSRIASDDLDRFLAEGVSQLERLACGAFESEPGLIREVEGVDGARLRLRGTPERLAGRLELSYDSEWVDAPETPEPWNVERDGEIHRFPPAGQSIARARRELEELGFRRDDREWTLEGGGVLARVLAPRPGAFVKLELPRELHAYDLVDRAPVLEVKVGAPEGWSGMDRAGTGVGSDERDGGAELPSRAATGVAWFETSFTLRDGDRELDVDLDALRDAAASDPGGLFALPDGTVLSLAHEPVQTLLELSESGASRRGRKREALELPLASLGELLEPRPGHAVDFAPGVLGLARALERSVELPAPALEPDVERVLRPYQKEAVRWFHHLARWGLSGILADEMGLGKTLMVLAHLFGRQTDKGRTEESDPVLVIAPTSLIFNWIDECRRFFPGVRAEGLQGLPAPEREERITEGAGVLVTSYALLRRDREALKGRRFRAVVLDEGQHIKNAESQTAQAAFALECRERWILTGTPVENHLGELWSLFHFLMPGFLGDAAEFRDRYGEPARRGEKEVLRKLRSRVRPFVLRRTKDQVLRELPPRIDQVERVSMPASQRRIYEEYLLRARSELEKEADGDSSKARFKVLAALTRLRQICCHPALVLEKGETSERARSGGRRDADDDDGADTARLASGKFDLLVELLEECVEEEHRVLLFSQFTTMLDLIEERLRDEDIRFTRLDGSTRDREGVVKKFQEDPGIPVFLISLKAGGHGLNLTQADTVIIYDPWWNPAAEEQAASRAHRMGQSLPVHVHKLITAGTVEEKILELQRSKKELAESILRSEDEALEALGLDDLRKLIYE